MTEKSAYERFLDIFQRYENPLMVYALSKFKNYDDARDAVQEIFTNLFRLMKQGKAKEIQPGYLYQSVRNLHVDKNRLLTRLTEYTDMIQSREQPKFQYLPRENVESETLERIHNLIQALPEAQRETIELKYIHGLTFPEIAQLTGCSVNTASTRAKLGLTKIRKKLETSDPGGRHDETK